MRVRSGNAASTPRLGFGSKVGGPEESAVRVNILSPSGDGSDVELLGTVSKVLVRSGVLRVWVAEWMSGLQVVRVEGSDINVVFSECVV